MSVTEQFEGWGKFDLTLKGLPDDTTPSEVWRALDPAVSAFGHVLITPTRVDPAAVGDAGLLSMAKYAGIYRGTRSRNQLTGVGLVAWLGDEDEKGDVAETPKTGGAGTFAAWVADVLPDAITAGTITAIAGTLTESMTYMSPRAMLARVMDYFGGVYRVNPDGTLDAGPEASLFATDPHHLLHYRGSGPDGGLHGLRPGTIELARDLEDYTTEVIMLAEGEGTAIAVGSAVAGSVPYKDMHGNAVVLKRIINAPDVSAGNANTLAAAQLGRFNKVRTGYRLSTTEWGVAVLARGGKRLEPGDYVWVYDSRPDARLVDPANQVVFQGETTTPALMRLEALTWPILEGMGVYLRYYDGAAVVIVDLAPHVEWESGETTLEVGAAPRRVTDTGGESAVQARVTTSALARAQDPDSDSFTNTGFADLNALTGDAGNFGPVAVTVQTGTRARVTLTANLSNASAGQLTILSYRISGATTLAASDARALYFESEGATQQAQMSWTDTVDVTPGTNTFELQARASGGTAFLRRPTLVVEPLP